MTADRTCTEMTCPYHGAENRARAATDSVKRLADVAEEYRNLLPLLEEPQFQVVEERRPIDPTLLANYLALAGFILLVVIVAVLTR